MKIYTNEKLKKIYKVCAILGAILTIAIFAIQPIIGNNDIPIIGYILGVPFSFICQPFGMAAFVFNWRRIIRGYIAPIILVSAFIEFFKGYFVAIKAFVAMLKHQDFALEVKR